MNTSSENFRASSAGPLRVVSRFLQLGAALLALAAAAPAQTVAPLSVANESPGGYNSDVYRWFDAAGRERTAVLTRNNAADPGGSRGGVLHQFKFHLPDGTERVITGTGAHSYNGWGYVVNHYDTTAYVSTGTTGTYRRAFTGRHHAIHEFKLTYPINGTNITATIHYFFATGQDHPIYAITYDTGAAGAGGFTTSIDSRAPYGDMQFTGDGTNPNVSGVAWGDKFKFFTRDEPLTPQSRWDYTQANTVPYTQMWVTSPDGEMGAVQTQSWLQHNTGGSWFTNNWGHTSENRVDTGSEFGAWLMPTNWQWPYQLNQYEMMDNTSPTNSKRCAWGLMYGAVGKTSYDGYGYENTFSGHPFQSYSVAMVIGRHSTADVPTQVTRTERVLAATITAGTGSLVTAGPGGAGRTDTVAYAKPGYNATYGVYELTANGTGSFAVSLNSSGVIKNPTFLIHGLGGVPAQINLDGTALVADQGYFASYDSATQSVWLTLNSDWNGNHTVASGAGVPPAVTVVVYPAAVAVPPGGTTTFNATVSNTANQAVSWSVVEAGGGNVTTGGVYTAPATAGTYHVRATSVADTTKSADAAVTVALTPPSITSFSATPTAITSGQSSTLSWNVSGETNLSINQGVGAVTGTSKVVTPAATTVYTLTATGPGGTASATTGVQVGTPAASYTYVYQSGLKGGWADTGWGATVNFAATTVGHTGTATAEVSIPNAWQGFALGDVGPGWSNVTYHSLSTVTTLEFDVYIASDSTGHDNVLFLLGDGTGVDQPSLTSLITGWSTMTSAQRFNQWHHVTINLASLHPTISSFFQFVFFKMSATGAPHFRLADIRYGSVADVLPPTITAGTPVVDYDQLTLPFTTSESAIYRVEYGYGSYSQTLTGNTSGWATSHSPVLTGLTRGATLQYRIVAIDPSGNEGFLTGSVYIVDPAPPTSATVTITLDPANTRPISPWIYGMNFYQSSASVVRNLTINRQGGNRWTAYNWENNASNAGADWYYHNDDFLGGGTTPGEAVRPLIEGDRTRGNASIITVQMQGYVAADKNGDDVTAVTPLATRLATRFKQVVFKKSTITSDPFTLTPPTTDAYVYMDEFLWALGQKLGTGIFTDPVKPTFVLLDNEPELWPSTHAEIQAAAITPADYIQKAINLSKALKDVAPGVKVFGPVHYGFAGIYNWQSAAGFTDTYWFTDKFLTDMKAASQTDGRRLLDVYNFHWYSEATAGGTRVVNFTGTSLTDAQIQAIVQSPRSLWDPTYTETSWITQAVTGGPIRLLPRIQAKIDAIWPGTGLAITEWNNGGNNHIAGAIAVADNLGIFGQNGVYQASMWPLGTITSGTFDGAGFKMYRDFDGALGTFGDISIPTVSSDTAKVSAYVSRDSVDPRRHVIVAINRSNAPQTVGFSGLALTGSARLFRLSGASATPASVGTATVDLATWLLTLPAYTVTTVEITAAAAANTYAAWRAANFSVADQADTLVSGPYADPDGSGLSNLQRYAFNLAPRGAVSAPTTLGTVNSGGVNYLTLAFNRRAAATDLSYVVEGSSDLATWTTVSTTAPGAPAAVTVQDSVAMSAVSRRFLRVRLAFTP